MSEMIQANCSWSKTSGETDLGAKRLTHHDTVYMKIACWVLSIKPKVEIESTLEKTKVSNICVLFDKISIVSLQTRETF